MLLRMPAQYKTDLNARLAFHFYHDASVWVSNTLWDDKIYYDWSSLEHYLNRILKSVTPQHLRKDTSFKVIIYKSGELYAHMEPSGHFFISIGMLAEFRNEAMIAGLMAHELAHYYLQHSLHTYVKKERGEFDIGLTGISPMLYTDHLVKNEMKSDSLGLLWLDESGYDIEGLKEAVEVIGLNERNQRRKKTGPWSEHKVNHPAPPVRLTAIDRIIQRHPPKNRIEFQILSFAEYDSLRDLFKNETLQCFMTFTQYEKVIEKGFLFHIFDPDNSTYLYSILEGIRRYCYLDYTRWSRSFIYNFYHDSINLDGLSVKEWNRSHIFQNFDFSILPINPKEGPRLKAKFYWKDAPRFTTYEGAFNFYYKVCIRLGINEAILTNALSFTDSLKMRDRFLHEYLSKSDILHREFAQALLDSKMYEFLPEDKLVVYTSFMAIVSQAEQKIYYPRPDLFTTNPVKNLMDSALSGLPGRRSINLHDFKPFQMRLYSKYISIQQFAFLYLPKLGEMSKLYILAPEAWEFLRNNLINEAEFVYCHYQDLYPKGPTIENYKLLCDLTYDDLFRNSKGSKNFGVSVFSFRIIKNGLLQMSYGYSENNLKTDYDIRTRFAQLMRITLIQKDKHSKKKDYQAYLRNK